VSTSTSVFHATCARQRAQPRDVLVAHDDRHQDARLPRREHLGVHECARNSPVAVAERMNLAQHAQHRDRTMKRFRQGADDLESLPQGSLDEVRLHEHCCPGHVLALPPLSQSLLRPPGHDQSMGCAQPPEKFIGLVVDNAPPHELAFAHHAIRAEHVVRILGARGGEEALKHDRLGFLDLEPGPLD